MKIAFRRDSEIYVMNADGSGQINLTNYPGVDYQPCWSPDGTQIAFTSERTGRGDIYVMNADGTGVTRLTSDSDLDGQPSWSPDGTKIAFMSTRDPNPPNGEIYVMNADGSGQTRLTNNPARDADPSWSPAGTEIAFMSSTYDGKDGNGAIYLMNADGGGLKRLSNSVAGWVGEPSWSPDGTQIAFASDIFIDAINTNGSGQTHLIYNAALPSWGEGFRLIGSTAVGGTVSRVMAIENRGNATLEISAIVPSDLQFSTDLPWYDQGLRVAVNAGTSLDVPVHFHPTSKGAKYARLTILSNNPQPVDLIVNGTGLVPDFQVAGKIAYVSGSGPGSEIYVANPDGSGQTNLTDNSVYDAAPSWSPDGTKIAFMSIRDGNLEVYAMNADGTGVTQLTDNPAFDGNPSWSPDGTQIALVSDRDGNSEVYAMNADGSGVIRLTDNGAHDSAPSWSPDGTKIAFVSTRTGNSEVYVMNADGSGQVNLTDNGAFEAEPSWSPDGTKIAFRSNRDGIDNDEVYVMNADGSGQTRISNHPALDTQPSWSPDGTKIAFVSTRTGNSEVYVMDADGTNPVRSTDAGLEDAPSWGEAFRRIGTTAPGAPVSRVMRVENSVGVPLTVSNITSSDGQFSASPKSFTVPVGGGQDVTVTFTPASLGVKYATLAVSSNDPNAPTARLTVNGTAVVSDLQIAGKIAFASDRDGNQEIYTMNADGTGLTRLTSHDFVDYNPSWSPDGNRIAFRSQRTGNGDIYAVNEDGSGLTRLTSHPAADGLPSWSPDGAKIAFISNRDGNLNFDIHTMNADGSGVTRLTSDGALDTDPSWSPNGMKIVFTSFRTGNGDIYVMDPDGSGQNRRTFDEAHDGEPAWSPDLTQIAFMSRRTGNGDIYVMNADGTGVTRLTSDSAFDGEPAWSPDGKKIAFRSDRDGNRELYAMNADGTGQARLTSQAAVDFDPSWGEAFRRIGATAVGTPVTRVMQVENRGQWPLVVSDINFSFGDGQFEASPTSFNVNPGGSQEMAVTFNPTSVGAKYVFLNISSNAPGPPVRLMVNGTVASPNQPPVLTVPGAQEVDEGQTLSFNVSATDPDPGQTVTITAAGLPDGAAFSNGAFSWTPSLTQAGSYTVTFTAADDGSPNLSDGPKSVSIRVDDGVQVGSGITSNPLDAATGATPITLTFETVTQAGGSSLATSSSGPMPPANFSLSDPEIYYDLHTTAVFSGYIEVSIHYDEVAFDDESELRLFHFENDLWMDVTIALDTDADVITGRVTSLSPFAVFESENDPPVLILPGDQTADEGSALSFNVTAEDPDEGQTVTIVAQNLPEGAVFDGTIFTWTPSFTQAGNYTVSFTATDNGAPAKGDAKTVAIAVNNLNSAPLAAAGADQSVECVSHSGVQVALDGSQSSDLDGDELSYRWLENNRQIATGIEPTVTLGLGKHTITLVVKDGSLESQPDEATVTVQDTQPPTLTLNGSAQVTLECHVDTYTEEGAQASDACDPNPKVSISGSVDTQKLGNYTITYTAIDASGNSASVTRAVQVQDTAPPQVQAALERVQVRRDDEGDEEHRGNLFQVKVAATDRCDPNPQITALLSQPLSSGDQVDIRYKKQKKVEIQIHQGKKLQVRLCGPSERELRRLLEQALQAGGFVVSDGQMVRLHLQEQGHGDREDDEEEGGFKYRFDRQLKLMSASGRDLALRASATDASGNQSAVVEVIPPRQRLTKPVAGAEEEAALPPRFSLQPNYPNPFNPSTTLRYELDDLQEVRLSIYNVMGQEMWVLVDQAQGPGRYEVEWDGRDALGHPVGAGIYLYRLQAGGSTQVRKMTLVK